MKDFEQEPCDLLVRHGFIVTMDGARRVVPDGAIAVRGRNIVAVGDDATLAAGFDPQSVLDAEGGIVHPGFIDGHVHVSHGSARGALDDSVDFDTGMLFYAAWWRGLTESDERASALAVATELVMSGTTCMVEAGTALWPGRVAEALQDVGMRGLVADPWLWDVPNLAGSADRRIPPSLDRSLDVLGSELGRNADDGLVRGYIALYGIGTSSDELVLAAKNVARSNHVLFAQHQSYARSDTDRDADRFGTDPILHYKRLGVLDEATLFVHMNILTDSEMEVVVSSGMGVVACVTSEMSWGTGCSIVARHDELHQRGVPIAFGSDSSNSALRWDTSEQALLALLTARERRQSRAAMLASDALEMLTIQAARAIGLDEIIGSLEPGKRADFVIRSHSSLLANPRTQAVQNLVLTQRASTVDTVVVDGEIVVRNGSPTKVDEHEVSGMVETSSKQMLERISQ